MIACQLKNSGSKGLRIHEKTHKKMRRLYNYLRAHLGVVMQARPFSQALLLVCWLIFSVAAVANDDTVAASGVQRTDRLLVANEKTPTSQANEAAEAKTISHVRSRMIANTKAIASGKPFKIGVEFETDPHWHIYYKESGDAGMPTGIEWKLPPGFKASELEWEKPKRFSDAGIVTYGYDGKTLIGATITPPDKLAANTPFTFLADVKYLACKDLCLPGKTQLSLSLSAAVPGAAAEPVNSAAFGKLGFKGPVSTLKSSATPDSAVMPVSNVSTADLPDSPAIDVPVESVKPVSDIVPKSILDKDLEIQGAGTESTSLLTVLFLAFIGGFILNFMPCVLPVISIKVLSFMQQAGEDPKRVFQLGLTFTAGIVSSFMALAAVIILFQQAGQRVGWGFQFQYPIFLVLMSCVILFFALSMFGLFYIQVTAGQSQVDKLASKEGLAGTFFKGVLATILSTPCTAPALGTALGFAFTQPWWVICLVFFTISIGMSFPYVILTANPGWMKYIPKPGVWMEKFKEGMGFLMLATVIWLLYVLAQQVGINAALATAGFLVVLSFAVWVVGRFTDLTTARNRKMVVYAIACGIITVGVKFLLMPYPQLLSTTAAVATPENAGSVGSATSIPVQESKDGLNWEPFTIAALDRNIAAGKTVFLDFTADWCLTCKVNESQVINTPPVIEKLKSLKVVTMKADWTRQDSQITALLNKFGRSGVPLYVVFPAGKSTQPIVLPEVITQQIVLENLDKADASH